MLQIFEHFGIAGHLAVRPETKTEELFGLLDGLDGPGRLCGGGKTHYRHRDSRKGESTSYAVHKGGLLVTNRGRCESAAYFEERRKSTPGRNAGVRYQRAEARIPRSGVDLPL